MKRKIVGQLVCGLVAALVLAAPTLAGAREIPVVNGENWTKSTPQEREAFLVGAATIIELDQEVQGTNPDKNSTIDTWAKGLSHYTFDEMRTAIDKWYAEHPDRINRPVVEVMWYEMAKPNCGVTNFDPPKPDGDTSMTGKTPSGQAKAAKP